MLRMNRKEIFRLTKKFYDKEYKDKKFIPGVTKIPCSAKTFDEKEMINLVDSALDFWLTSGRYEKAFTEKLCKFLGSKFAISANSGTSANLLAMSAIAKPKAEVITTAAGFPTTISPIVQNHMIPVFIDVELGNYNVNPEQVEKAISPKTRAVFLAHTMGFPFDVHRIQEICTKYNILLVEDNCDSLGARFDGKYTGTFGLMSTHSFYPAHHITTGEGGAVVTDFEDTKQILQSYRDWGRDCWCDTGHDNTCGKRFSQKFGELPLGYDHKYVYSHLGYNLKMTEMQAAIGLAQLKKLPDFIQKRLRNFNKLYKIFKSYEDIFILPESLPKAVPSPFGFLLTLKDDAPFRRYDIVNFLEHCQIQTRPLFAGNMVKQPCMKNVKYRIFGKLKNTDKIMNDTFWIGVHPGITDEMIEYIEVKLEEYFR